LPQLPSPRLPYTTLFRSGQVAVDSGAQKGAELCFKNIRLFQADADRAVSEGGIVLFAQVEVIHLLVRSDIKSTDDHFLAGHHLRSEEHTSELQSRFDLVC